MSASSASATVGTMTTKSTTLPKGLPQRRWRYVGRVKLYLPTERVLCPHRHPLAENVSLLPSGLRQCRWRNEPERHQRSGAFCPVWLWQYDHTDGSRTVVWVDDAEAEVIRMARMDLTQARDYLGLSWATDASHV
jgi:hypothetical protein